LEKGYQVHGMIRRSASSNTSRIDHIIKGKHKNKFFLHFGDLSDSSNISKLIMKIKPNEIYNLGGQSHVKVSFDAPEYTADVVGLGVLRILEAIKKYGINTKFFQASSSEMFGKVKETPQKETTPFHSCSPYGCAKLFAYWMTINYRENY
jgi:GDPmannose 4,6-dehydratase